MTFELDGLKAVAAKLRPLFQVCKESFWKIIKSGGRKSGYPNTPTRF
jgi:hypothetical protein